VDGNNEFIARNGLEQAQALEQSLANKTPLLSSRGGAFLYAWLYLNVEILALKNTRDHKKRAGFKSQPFSKLFRSPEATDP
jgi:hypothetical protein